MLELLHTFYDGQAEYERKPRVLRQFMPTEMRESILDINFETWKLQGVNTLLLDAEGTLLPVDTWDIDEQIVEKLQQARAAGMNISIVTNKVPRDEISFLKLTYWAKQVGADLCFVPKAKRERKPSPILYLKALSYYGIRADQALVVGDKATGDILGANRAGIRSVLVAKMRDPNDDRDYIGEKMFRDPIEDLWRSMLMRIAQEDGLPENPDPSQAATGIEQHGLVLLNRYEEGTGSNTEITPGRWDYRASAQSIARSALVIAGYGAADVVLPRQVREKVHLAYGPGASQVQKVLTSSQYQQLTHRLNRHFSEHGQLEADILTLARVLLTAMAGYAAFKERYALAAALEFTSSLTDFEGALARRDNKSMSIVTEKLSQLASKLNGQDKKIDGKQLDPLVDKVQAFIMSSIMALRDRDLVPGLVSQTARDRKMNKEREVLRAEGIDSRALWSGKASTVLSDFVRVAVLLFGRNHRIVKNTLWLASTGVGKWGSFYHEKGAWRKLDEWKRADLEKVPQVRELLQAA